MGPELCHFRGNVHAMPPFRLDEEDQDWLEILVKVDKGQSRIVDVIRI